MSSLSIETSKILYNFEYITELCKKNELEFIPVTKCVRSDPVIINLLRNHGLASIADSHQENLVAYKNKLSTVLLSTASSLIKSNIFPDFIYTTDPYLINALSRQDPMVKFIIPLEMGGLREGLTVDDFGGFVTQLESTSQIAGFSANFGCIHGIMPDLKAIRKFIHIAYGFAETLKITSPIISAGGTILYEYLENGQLPGGLTHIRMGESLLFGFSTYENADLTPLKNDVFTLYGEAMEVRTINTNIRGKVKYNIFGKIFDNSRGFMNAGIRRRMLLDFGVMTANMEYLTPGYKNLNITGQSYDHTIVDYTHYEGPIDVGDLIPFSCKYDAVARAYLSPYIKMIYL